MTRRILAKALVLSAAMTAPAAATTTVQFFTPVAEVQQFTTPYSIDYTFVVAGAGGGDRGDVDDRSPPPADHRLAHGAAAVDDAEQVDGEDLLEIGWLAGPEQGVPGHAGVGHENV